MGAELLRTENVARVVQDFPVFGPAMGRLDAFAAGAVEQFRRRRIQRHGENIGAQPVQGFNVAAVHGRRVGQN
jgi:hypothetical protein